MAHIVWAPRALADLEDLIEFISRNVPMTARDSERHPRRLPASLEVGGLRTTPCQDVSDPRGLPARDSGLSPGAEVANLKDSPASGEEDRKSTRLNSSHIQKSRMPSSA